MQIRYETSIATLVQFLVGTVLTFLTGAASIIGGCRSGGGADCVSNAFVSLLFVILVVAVYGSLLGLGYVAQEKRSSRLALFLIGVEAFAALIFLFDARQAPGLIDKITNAASFIIAAWVIFVAFNLYRAKGGRIVKVHAREPKL